MFTLVLRGSLALSATVGLLAIWMNPFVAQTVSGAPFSTVLQELRGATTLLLQLEKGGQTSEILVRAPGLVRKQETPQRYQIAIGSRWWKIDEAENTVAEGDSPWFLTPEKQVDLLGLLDVGVNEASALLTARPTRRIVFQGQDCMVYQVILPTSGGQVRIEAYADNATNQLVGIIARDPAAGERAVPLAELRLVALNPVVKDEQFVVAKSLTEDGRIGKIERAQGIVVLRPALARRWTPVCRESLLRPGDWLRTEVRGANAVQIQLSSDVELTLGPGTLLECVSPTQARLHSGQVQIVSLSSETPKEAAKVEFTLLAPRTGSHRFKPGTKQLVRVDTAEKIVDVPQVPVWLAGFEGTTSNESLGSLIVNLPDGRNEPLSVGYHKVFVEIRDQIARTTIEESFVNHTKSRLEGVFHFPLPQDASISGFGMWIGDELIEADVVEKQRAREIFETILRERRDPGLLEWMGGNIFKARVFPIEPHSEKRIKIVYTQVLPLRANRYRYSYGLRSELLRTKPLRELSLSVTVNSVLPLKSLACPTHSVRTELTAHSGHVEFAAQEYIPTRDFDVVCEVDGRQSDVVVIPHRRGDDGYFLVQLTPPGLEGNWQRELLPDGNPLQVLLLCDTSASMDAEKRRQQAEFVGTVLTSLSDDDRFQVVCTDVGTAWGSPQPMAPTAENIATARAFLEERVSLGWTNLDRAFADVVQKGHAAAHVIYVGDGIASAGTTDSAAFVQKLKQLVGQADSTGPRRTFHSVTVGNSHEAIVMQGIAQAGRGSARAITGEQTPNVVALELLNEIAQPGLRDLNVEFRGLRVAAVYPSQLPNLAAGTQQVLVGRYLPEGKDQTGEIIVTGLRGGEKVKYAAKVSLKDAEEGNSFIPRLWARAHLDQLLAQGPGATVRDDIIRLSEEFHIITPFTSLLVLESDADRERFGVKRRYEMRDGERFFADGKANANFELVQAQMKKAGNWRLGLRQQVATKVKGLGRNVEDLAADLQRLDEQLNRTGVWNQSMSLVIGGSSWGGGAFSFSGGFLGGVGGGMGGGMGGMGMGGMGGGGIGSGFIDNSGEFFEGEESREMDEFASAPDFDQMILDPDGEGISVGVDSDSDAIMPTGLSMGFGGREVSGPRLDDELQVLVRNPLRRSMLDRTDRYAQNLGSYYFQTSTGASGVVSEWFQLLFPTLPPVPWKPAVNAEDAVKWSPEAIALSDSLLRLEGLKRLEGGVRLRRVTQEVDPRWNRLTARRSELALYSPFGWVTHPLNRWGQTVVNYCTPQETGAYSPAFLLGRQRAFAAGDINPSVLQLNDYSLVALREHFLNHEAKVEAVGDHRVLLLSSPESPDVERFLIDTQRRVLLKHESLHDGKITGTWTFGNFVELGGLWWASQITHLDAEGTKTSESNLDLQLLDRPTFTQQMNEALTARASVQFIQMPFVGPNEARHKISDGSATFDHRLSMILHLALRQQWNEMWKQVEAMEQAGQDKPGLRWIRTALLIAARRNVEATARLQDELRNLVANSQPEELFFAETILDHISNLTEIPEYLPVVLLSRPVFDRQEKLTEAVQSWTERLIFCHENMGQIEQAMELKQTLAKGSPWHLHWQTTYALMLARNGQLDAALAWLIQELNRPVKRSRHEDDQLRYAIAEMYRSHGRWSEMLKVTSEWVALNPDSTSYNAPYPLHLVALIDNDKLDEANSLVQRWLDEARVDGELTAVQQAKFDAALKFALGESQYLSSQRVDERWLEPLAQMARFFVRHPHHSNLTAQVMSGDFLETETADRLRGEFLNLLRSEIPNLTPAQVTMLLGFIHSRRIELPEPLHGRRQMNPSEVPRDVWMAIATPLQARWEQTRERKAKNELAEALRTIYSQHFSDSLYLPFLRQQLAVAFPEDALRDRKLLFDTLLEAEWTPEIEAEAFGLLQDLSAEKDPVDRLLKQLPALHQLVDAMLENRQSVAESKLADEGGQVKRTRKELAAIKSQMRLTALTGLADRLAEVARTVDGPLSDWLAIEQSWLDLQAGRNRPQVLQFCWKVLGETPPPLQSEIDPGDDVQAIIEPELMYGYDVVPVDRRSEIESILRRRAFATVFSLAMSRNAAPETVSRLLKYIDAGVGLELAALKPGSKQPWSMRSSRWRNTLFECLVALDRPDDLDRRLRQWIREDVSTSPWRQMLARLLAERGDLDEAIRLFEACEKAQLLSPGDYRTLADWYQVRDRRADYDRARIAAYQQMSEETLHDLLRQLCDRWDQAEPPTTELDDRTLLAFKALFEKGSTPEASLDSLRAAFVGTRDFRLLQILPDAVLGRSPLQIYTFLQSLQSGILNELRTEAAADEILSRLKLLRTEDRTSTDLRALDLLEALVERISSEVLNQGEAHADASLAALQRAFARQWKPGEPLLMSKFLCELGSLPPKLAEEQLRQVREMRDGVAAHSRDRLTITDSYCKLLSDSYQRREEAIRDMEVEVRDYLQANHGLLPHSDESVISNFVTLYEQGQQHAAGEVFLRRLLEKPQNKTQRQWIEDRLTTLLIHAFEADSATSLGSGRPAMLEPLYRLLAQTIEKSTDERVRYQEIVHTVNLFSTALRHEVPQTQEFALEFAFETLPEVLKRQVVTYRDAAVSPVSMIRAVAGPKLALRYVLERIEQYPQRLEFGSESAAHAFGQELARLRADTGRSEFDDRVLRFALQELRFELRTGIARGYETSYRTNQYFWAERIPDFIRVSDEVLAENKSSGRCALNVARYVRSGLGLHPRSVEILLVANKQGLLDDAAQTLLINWLHEDQRFAESIPLLEALIEVNPRLIHYREQLMTAYFKTNRPQQLTDLIRQTDERFHREGLWRERIAYDLGHACLNCQRFDHAAQYLVEATVLYQRANPNSGVYDATLAGYYQDLARAYSHLKKTREAVDAISAAIVCRGMDQSDRESLFEELQRILQDAEDLDEYVQHLDAESARTGQDSPILRKAVGLACLELSLHEKAIPQLRLAMELQPHDPQTYDALLTCYDATNDAPAAIRLLLKKIELKSHDLGLFEQLADRLSDNEEEAERAVTSIIEASPNEAENHAAMAERRQQQDRWGEAIVHWERVAELRKLEPTGLLKLAEAQIHEQQWNAARSTIRKLRQTQWPPHFTDVESQAGELEMQIPRQ